MRTTSAPGDAAQQARTLYAEIDALYEDVRATGGERYREWLPHIARLGFRPSAHNLAAYLAFREHDLRGLQDRLEPLGLSSLGRCEAHVLPALEAVRATLAALGGRDGAPAQRPRRRDFALGDRLLERHTRAAHHGHAGIGGRDRRRVRTPAGRRGDGLRAHQLRPRRRGDLDGDGGERPPRGGGSRAPLSRLRRRRRASTTANSARPS
jgi:pyruvate kinase